MSGQAARQMENCWERGALEFRDFTHTTVLICSAATDVSWQVRLPSTALARPELAAVGRAVVLILVLDNLACLCAQRFHAQCRDDRFCACGLTVIHRGMPLMIARCR